MEILAECARPCRNEAQSKCPVRLAVSLHVVGICCALGCVLKAQDPDGGQTVALKTFDIHSLGDATAEALRCALAEADSTKALNSHNVVLHPHLPPDAPGFGSRPGER